MPGAIGTGRKYWMKLHHENLLLQICIRTVTVRRSSYQRRAVGQRAANRRPTATPQADNTRMNQRDRNSNEATADQQKMTSRIATSLSKFASPSSSDKSLSTYGHNVKVITQNGMVTLKGPVRSEEEKKAVEAKAAEVAGADKVTNEIDVQPKH